MKTAKNSYHQDLLSKATKHGYITISDGVYLHTKENINADQVAWDDEDPSKNLNFTSAPFWLITDCGAAPRGIVDAEDLAEVLEN